jgi:hypothetical protein
MIMYYIFLKSRRNDFESFLYKEMVNVWVGKYLYIYSIYTCIKYYMVPH